MGECPGSMKRKGTREHVDRPILESRLTPEQVVRMFATIDTSRPHKPLLILLFLQRVKLGISVRLLPFEDIESQLKSVLRRYFKGNDDGQRPEEPFWFLQFDDVWEIEGFEGVRTLREAPSPELLSGAFGGFPEEIHEMLVHDSTLFDEVLTITIGLLSLQRVRMNISLAELILKDALFHGLFEHRRFGKGEAMISPPYVMRELERRWQLWKEVERRGVANILPFAAIAELGLDVSERKVSSVPVFTKSPPVGIAFRADTPGSDSLGIPRTDFIGPELEDADIQSLLGASEMSLPIFVITPISRTSGSALIEPAFIDDFDLRAGLFRLSHFGDERPDRAPALIDDTPTPFCRSFDERIITILARRGQKTFRDRVYNTYGRSCIVCTVSVRELVNVTAVVPYSQGGSFHECNGIPLCVLHQRALEKHLWTIRPSDYGIVFPRADVDARALAMDTMSLAPFRSILSKEAVSYIWLRSGE